MIYPSKRVEDVIGGRHCYFRSQFEWKWARWLEMLKQAGEIDSWEYEPKTFVFPGETRGAVQYTPDFRVIEDGVTIWHECKGRLTGRDNTKLRRMAKYYPGDPVVLVLMRIPKREPGRLRIARKYACVIDGGKILRQAGIR